MAVKDIREELARMGHTFTRAEVDAELARMTAGDGDGVAYTLNYPQGWPPAMAADVREQGFRAGGEQAAFIKLSKAKDLPPPLTGTTASANDPEPSVPRSRPHTQLVAQLDSGLARRIPLDKIRDIARRWETSTGLRDDETIAPLIDAVYDGDRDQIRAAVDTMAAQLGMTGVGEPTPDFDTTLTDAPPARPTLAAQDPPSSRRRPGTGTGQPAAPAEPQPFELPRSRPQQRRLIRDTEERVVTNLDRLSDRGPVTLQRLQTAMPDLDRTELDRLLADWIARGWLALGPDGGYRITDTGREHEASRYLSPRLGQRRIGPGSLQLPARQRFNQTAAMNEFQGRMPEDLEDYWLHDPEVLAKIRWGTRGSFRRARRLLRGKVPRHMLNGAVANLYHKATGRWPGRHRNQTAAVDARGNLHDQRGRFAEKSGVLDPDAYGQLYGTAHDEQSVDLGDRALTVRFFDLGDAHLVVDGDEGHQVVGETDPAGMRELADDLEDLLMTDDPDPEDDAEDPSGDQVEEADDDDPDDDAEPDQGHGFYITRGEDGAVQIGDAGEETLVDMTEQDAWQLVGALRDMADSYDTNLGTQTAAASEFHAGHGDCGKGQHRMPDGSCMDDAAMSSYNAETAEVWRWEGPMVPLNAGTSDAMQREIASGALSSRSLPRPLRWQEKQEPGHNGAVVVGALTGYAINPDGTPWGTGWFFDERIIPEAARARYLVEQRVIAPSLDLEPSMDVTYVDAATGSQFSPTCSVTGSCPAKAKAVITRGTVAGATLVPIAAFGQLPAPRLFRGPQPETMAYEHGTQIAAVNTEWDDLPVADLDHPWDPSEAQLRLAQWAGLDEHDAAAVWEDFAAGHLFQHLGGDPSTVEAYGLQVVDVVDGELAIVPAAVFAAAALIAQAGVPTAERDMLRDVVSDLHDRISDELSVDVVSPWEGDGEQEEKPAGCGCAAKFIADQTASADTTCTGSPQYGVFGDMAPYPAEVFAPRKFTAPTTPIVEQRPGEQFARVAGHIGLWEGCHRGFKHVCLPPPRSRTGYNEFHTAGHVRTSDGLVRVGKMVMGEGHPDSTVPARVARAFYDATSKQVAFGRVYDDEFGPYFAGVLAPNVTPEEATTLLASPVSGDWKNHELLAVLAVNVAGHPIRAQATFAADGEVVNVTAAGRFWPDDDAGLESVFAVLEERDMVDRLWMVEHRQLCDAIGGL